MIMINTYVIYVLKSCQEDIDVSHATNWYIYCVGSQWEKKVMGRKSFASIAEMQVNHYFRRPNFRL